VESEAGTGTVVVALWEVRRVSDDDSEANTKVVELRETPKRSSVLGFASEADTVVEILALSLSSWQQAAARSDHAP
jgi:hypothetical protein